MIIIYSISVLLILLYLSYPFWLMLYPDNNNEHETTFEEVNNVSLILLSYNGKEYLAEKIKFLINEMRCFNHYELIIVDDHSTDGSRELLKKINYNKHVRLILQDKHHGIPHSMNLGVELARYNNIIFCDQRQTLSENIIQKIVEPLKNKNVGAVSGCISHLNKFNACSWVRKHENYIKSLESKSGNLIGVYGPFYAIRKDSYTIIPEDIVLDDLYLSLKIIQSKQIRIIEDCQIFDDGFSTLYDYGRARRYVRGFLQILKEKDFLNKLSIRQLTMLIWHKYLRLLIPFSLFLSYFATGVMGTLHHEYLLAFIIMTVIAIVSTIPGLKNKVRLANLISVNVFYLIAVSDISIKALLFNKDKR
ncbi:MAG: glycosyltransferase [Bacteroidota bacterium]